MVTQLRLPTTTSGSQDQDKVLASIVDKLTALLPLNDQQAIDNLIAEHPEHATTLRSLLPTLQILIELQTPEANSLSGQAVIPASTPPLGDFRLIREVGRGGMGVVYEAEQLSLSRRVAVKVLPFAAVLDPRRLQRFKNEALAAAHLDHPNIVEVYGVGCERCIHFYAMRFVEGQTLAAVIEALKRSRLPRGTSPAPSPSCRATIENGTCVVSVNDVDGDPKSQIPDPKSQSSDFKSQSSDPKSQSSDFKSQSSDFKSQSSDFKSQSSDFKSQSSDFKSQSSDFKSQISDFRFHHPASGPRSASGTYCETQVIAGLSTVHTRHPHDFFRHVAEIGIQAADALEHAHQMGIVHRDIKPSNLMLDTHGKLWITDFGLAHFESDHAVTLSGDLLGTLRYMSPEQADGGASVLDHRTDVYSLGITLYELLTLRPAFAAKESKVLLRQISDLEPVAPRKINRRIPPNLETIILKSMAKSPSDRYRSAGELSADLRRYLAGEPIHARPIGRLRRTWQWYKRSPTVAGLLTAVLVLALCVGVTGVLFGFREATHRHSAEASAKEAHWQQYLSDMHSAMAAWEDSNVGRTLELLERHRPKQGEPDLRGFEWRYLWKQCHDERLKVTIDETRHAECVAFSHDGRMLAMGREGGLARLRDALTGSLIHDFGGHDHAARSVAFSPDDTILATSDDRGRIRLWDVVNRRELRSFIGHSDLIMSVVFSSDGQRLASGGYDEAIRIWDVATGQELKQIRPESRMPAPYFLLSPWTNDRLWVYGSDGFLRQFDSGSGQKLRQIERKELLYASFSTVALSSDGKQAALAGRDGVVRLFDTETGQDLATLGMHDAAVRALAFSPDDQTLASSDSRGKVVVWDLKRREPRTTLRGHSGSVWPIAFSHDSQRLCTCGGDSRLRIWDVTNQSPNVDVCQGHNGTVLCVAISPDNRLMASGGGEAHGLVMLWDLASGRLVNQFAGHTNWVWSVAFSPNGKEVASASEDGTIRVWDLTERNPPTVIDTQKQWLTWVSYSRSGDELITCVKRGKLQVWDRNTGNEIRTFQTARSNVLRPALSPDGRLIATDSEGAIVLLAYPSLSVVKRCPCPLRYGNSIAISPDGRMIASCDHSEVVYLFSTDGAALGTLEHTSSVSHVEFSPDGRMLAYSDLNNEVHLWDIERRERRATLSGHDAWVNMARFSSDGNTLVSASNDGTIRIYSADKL